MRRCRHLWAARLPLPCGSRLPFKVLWYLASQGLTSVQTIFQLQTIFARVGIPDGVVSDNGTQFSSQEFRIFVETYRLTHVTSSPHFPEANGEAERVVQTAENILSQEDPFLVLMAHRSTSVAPTGVSPCKLIMGRQINTRVSTLDGNLHPNWPDGAAVHESDHRAKAAYKDNFNLVSWCKAIGTTATRWQCSDEAGWSEDVEYTCNCQGHQSCAKVLHGKTSGVGSTGTTATNYREFRNQQSDSLRVFYCLTWIHVTVYLVRLQPSRSQPSSLWCRTLQEPKLTLLPDQTLVVRLLMVIPLLPVAGVW